jgi:hypothetical protein
MESSASHGRVTSSTPVGGDRHADDAAGNRGDHDREDRRRRLDPLRAVGHVDGDHDHRGAHGAGPRADGSPEPHGAESTTVDELAQLGNELEQSLLDVVQDFGRGTGVDVEARSSVTRDIDGRIVVVLRAMVGEARL